MAECIEREATIKCIKEVYCVGCNSYNGVRCRACGTGDAIDIIKDAPAADVAPVVHGRWAHLGGDEWCCSACGFVLATEGSWDKPTKKYCEDCGAIMDGCGADHEEMERKNKK